VRMRGSGGQRCRAARELLFHACIPGSREPVRHLPAAHESTDRNAQKSRAVTNVLHESCFARTCFSNEIRADIASEMFLARIVCRHPAIGARRLLTLNVAESNDASKNE